MNAVLSRMTLLVATVLLFSACGGGGGGGGDSTPPPEEMTFRVTVPSNTPAGETIWLRTGMLFGVDERPVAMTKVSSSPDVWQASVTAPEGVILRYRYARGTAADENWDKEETYALRAHAAGSHIREALMRKGGTMSETVPMW